jgi:hypothetical protein
MQVIIPSVGENGEDGEHGIWQGPKTKKRQVRRPAANLSGAKS